MSKYKLVKYREFYINDAIESVYYELYESKKTIFGKEKWKNVKVYFWDGLGVTKTTASGDYNWARRIAKEFKITVPKEINNISGKK